MADQILDEFMAAWRAYRADPSPTTEAATQNAEWLLYKRDGGDAVVAAKKRAEQTSR